MKIPAAITFLLFVAAPALAQVDWDADNYGVFFDTGGTQTSLMTAPGAVTAYLVLLNPTVEAAAIDGWEAGCWSFREVGALGFPAGPALPLTFAPAVGGIIVPGDCGDGLWTGGGPGVLLPGDAVVLGRFETIAPTTLPYGFYDTAGGGVLAVVGGEEILLRTSTYPVSTMPPMLWLAATVNSEHVPVADEDLGWGSVKASYR